MARFVLAVVAVLGLSELAPARAQFFGGPFPASGFGYSSHYRSGFAFSFGSPHFRVSGFSGGFVTRSAFVAPPFAPIRPVVGFAPVGFGPAWGGWGPAFGPFAPAVVAVPVAVAVPIPVVVAPELDPNAGVIPAAPQRDPNLFPKDFLVIAPRRDAPAELPRPADVRPPGPVIMFDPFKEPVRVEVPDADPKQEAKRLVRLGKASFASGDYGRAAEHFERASTADPADALAYFLHGQARFAAGQYAEAAARIRDGLARDAKWPLSPFDPTELYGERPERFFAHRTALKKVLAENPGQATLEFLLGYQLWFSGEKAEADKLFRAAEARLPAPGPIGLFKLP